MATFEELFPEYAGSPPAGPFEPIKPRALGGALDLAQSRADTALGETRTPEQDLDELMAGYQPGKAGGDVSWGDWGKSFVSGVGALGQAAAGAGEYVSQSLAGNEASAPQRMFGSLAETFGEGRRAAGEFAQDWFQSMSPEAQARAAREFTTLDPNKAIWQGGVGEFLSSVGLKMSQAAPSTLVTLLPGGLLMRAGLGRGAISYLGASEGALSMGSIAANIADEIEQAPEAELMQSQLYQQLRQEMDDQSARQVLIAEAQDQAPLIGGLIVGAISAVAGRYLQPVFTDKAGGLFSRAARGAIAEGPLQEGPQSAAEQIAQNIAAQTFDSSRGMFEGAGEAAVQGSAIGAAMGGGFGAAFGPRRQQAIAQPALDTTMEPSEPAVEAAPTFDQVFTQQTPPEGGWRGGDIEFGALPDIDSTGQRLIAAGPVDLDVQAALNARRDKKIDDMFEQPDYQAEQRSYMQNPWPVQQTEMDLPQATTAVANVPQQRSLLTERVKGVGRVPVEPMAAQPLVEDMSAPPEFSLAAPPPGELARGRRPTRADFLREKANKDRAELTQGMVRDPRQQDLFETAPQLMPDQPSAEPIGDLNAQLEDLADPDSPRLGVYLSAANMQQVGDIPTVGVPLANFDGKGGTLIAKNREAANQLIALRDEGNDMQQILGLATGAGTGKQAGANIAVQQRDEAGNVVRESLVASPEEADELALAFEAPGRESVILSAPQAIRRREQKIAQEQQAGRERTAGRAARRRVEGTGYENRAARVAILQERLASAKKAQQTGTRSQKLKAQIEEKSIQEELDTLRDVTEANLDFTKAGPQFDNVRESLEKESDEAIAIMSDEKVDELFNEAARVASGSTAKIGGMAGGKMFGGDTSQPQVLTKELGKREAPSAELTRYQELVDKVIPRLEATVKKTPTKWWKTQLREKNEEAMALRKELDKTRAPKSTKLFPATPEEAEAQTREFMRRTQQESAGTRETGEMDATVAITPSGRTFEEIVAQNTTRSEKVKFIRRVKRLLRVRARGDKTKSRDITARGGIRESVVGSREDSKGKKTLIYEETALRKSALHPTKVMDIEPPREMSQAERAKHNARVRKTYHELDKRMGKFAERLEKLNEQIDKEKAPEDAPYARAYLNTLFRYGQMVAQLRPRSKRGLKEVERFIKLAGDLLDKKGDAFVAELSKAMQAETNEQARAAIRLDPTILKNMGTRRRRAALIAVDAKRRRTSIAWAERLNNVWKQNAKYNEIVAPLIKKLVGYVTRDSSLAGIPQERRGLGYIPTFNEMRQLRYALRDFKQTNKDGLYDPLRDWFTDFGFKFDENGDLKLAKNAAEFDYMQPTKVLEQGRDAMLGAPLNYSQKLRRAAKARYEALVDPERKRRASLTEEQRRKEDLSLWTKLERQRRAGMSYEQRKALEAMDRQGIPRLQAEELAADVPAVRAAAQRIGAALEAGPTELGPLMKRVAASLPAGPLRDIAERLSNLSMPDAMVTWGKTGDDLGELDDTMADHTGQQRRVLRLNRGRFEQFRANGHDPSWPVVHTFLHEALHAASLGALDRNGRLRVKMHSLLVHARNSVYGTETAKRYGFTNVDEFVAEAFTNPHFQNILRKIESNEKSLWRRIVDTIKEFLGLGASENVLDVIMSHADEILTGEIRQRTAGMEAVNVGDETMRGHIGNYVDKAMQSSRVVRDLRTRAKNIIEGNKEGGSRFLLSALTMEQIRDFYYKSFGGNKGPLNQYMDAFFKRNADNSANMEDADRLSRHWTKLTEEYGVEKSVATSQVMTEATLYGIHPDIPLSDELNKHIKSPEQKARHADLAKRYRELPAEYRKLYQDVKNYYAETFRKEVNLVTLNSLRAVLDGPFNYTEEDIERKKLNTIAGLEKEFGDRLTETNRKIIERTARLPKEHIGPYFPLIRFGEYVVTAERVKETKHFTDRTAARDWAREQMESDPTLSVSPPMEDDTGFTVTVKEKEVRMAETPSEAEANRQDMIAEYGIENVDREIQKKSTLYQRASAIGSGSGLRTILGKLDGNPAAQAAIKDFYLRSISDGAFRKREIKRAHRRGVDYDLQHRTFASYAKSAAYFMSQLRFGSKMAEALINMDKFAKDVAKGDEQSDISVVRMNDVVDEINTRDKLTHDPMEVSRLVRGGTEISQFMMLTSPSYWMINATQPYMVTLPWLAARSSMGEATAALTTAQSLIWKPIKEQMGESWGGLKALKSKAAAEKAFTVLDQVEEHITQRGGARAHEYISMLNKLKRDSIIDLSFVAELRDISEGQNTGVWQKVLDASRIMAHLTEVNNRIMTALAAYDLRRNQGASPEEAQGFAKQAVSLTQFNYSSGNAPRLFQARGPLGQMGPLVFQFMKYPQHMYALMIDNFRRAVQRGTLDAQVARRTLFGLFATHLAAGGMLGAMLQPVKWAIGLAMMAFGDDDEPYTFRNAMSGATADKLLREMTTELMGNDLGEIVSGGLPRAAGIDLSNRMSLGTLYMMDLNPKTSETLMGSLVQTFGGPAVNLVGNAYGGVQYMAEGQVMKGMEAFLPKVAKDALKATRFSNEGLTDATGKEIIGADQMTPWQLFTQSMGLQPSAVSEKYAARSAINEKKTFADARHTTLVTRYRNADGADRADVLREIVEFNAQNPAARITRSQLLKSVQRFREREMSSRRFGTVLEGDDVLYASEADPYNE